VYLPPLPGPEGRRSSILKDIGNKRANSFYEALAGHELINASLLLFPRFWERMQKRTYLGF
jgi:hypothetical protein